MQYQKIGEYGFGCVCCGRGLEPDDLVAVCPDCGAVFCQECAEAGAFESHACEDYEFYEEEDY